MGKTLSSTLKISKGINKWLYNQMVKIMIMNDLMINGATRNKKIWYEMGSRVK